MILVNIRFCSRHLFLTTARHAVYGIPWLSLSLDRNRHWRTYLFRHGRWFEVFRFFGYVSQARFDVKGHRL